MLADIDGYSLICVLDAAAVKLCICPLGSVWVDCLKNQQ